MRPEENSEKGIAFHFWWCILEEIPQEDKAMTQYTAKKTGFVMHDKHMDIVEYEYRGSTYEVRYAKDWTMSITSPRIQHREAQARIDEMIDNPAPERRCTEDAQVGFDKLWEYIQTGEWEE